MRQMEVIKVQTGEGVTGATYQTYRICLRLRYSLTGLDTGTRIMDLDPLLWMQ